MGSCICLGVCACGGAIVAGFLYYNYSNCNRMKDDCDNKNTIVSMV